MSTGTRVAIILILQTMMLLGMIATKQYTLNIGTPILLETEPVDPRSLFRGDYVILQYAINHLNPQELHGDKCYRYLADVFVTLEQQGKYWQAVATHHHRPAVVDGQAVIKGRTRGNMGDWGYESNPRQQDGEAKQCGAMKIKYLIENYFVPEGEGLALEQARQDEKVDIRVAVDKRGNAGILAVLVDDVERYTETLF